MVAAHPPTDVRGHLAVALDTHELAAARSMASAVRPYIGIAKVGLELFSAAGHAAVHEMRDAGMDVFLDLKLHDIPHTVHGASKVLGALGVRYLTVHAAGGEAMLRAAVEGLQAGADAVDLPAPVALAVTVLTSAPEASAEVLRQRLQRATAAATGGVVCAATDLPEIRAGATDLLTVVPGIRPAGVLSHDQARVATPAEAVENGADVLVLGRAVTTAPDPAGAARAVAAEVAQALAAATPAPEA